MSQQPDWSGLPVPSPVICAALRGIHPGLAILRSRYEIDRNTGKPKVHPRTKEPIERARYWVWITNAGKTSPLFPVETPEGAYLPCDTRLVHRIATDLGHATATYEEMNRQLDQHDKDREKKRRESERERFRRFIETNGRAWREAMANLRDGIVSAPRAARMKDPVIYGYNGQPIRSSSHNSVPKTAKDLGMETPNG